MHQGIYCLKPCIQVVGMGIKHFDIDIGWLNSGLPGRTRCDLICRGLTLSFVVNYSSLSIGMNTFITPHALPCEEKSKITNNACKQTEELSSPNRAIKIRENYRKLRNKNCISRNSFAPPVSNPASLCESPWTKITKNICLARALTNSIQ